MTAPGSDLRISAQEIDAARTERGGWTRETLAGWGVPWPPPKGWRQALIEGRSRLPDGHPRTPGTPAAEGPLGGGHLRKYVLWFFVWVAGLLALFPALRLLFQITAQ